MSEEFLQLFSFYNKSKSEIIKKREMPNVNLMKKLLINLKFKIKSLFK